MRTTTAAGRMDRLIAEPVHDPYFMAQKPPEPSVCPVCNAVFHKGRWQWAESWPTASHRELCQACRRERDDYPAGIITVRGRFVQQHRDEILNLVHHQEKDEKAGHPMHRLMKVEVSPVCILIKTTDVHLPRRIGEALRRAFKGTLDWQFDEDNSFVRVTWSRED